MSQSERLFRINQLLHERRVVPISTFLDELEISRATFKRDMDYLRDRLRAPIIWDREVGGYRFESEQLAGQFEMPGLWFSAKEAMALLSMQHVLSQLEPGLLSGHVGPFQARLRTLLAQEGLDPDAVQRRIRLLPSLHRPVAPAHFETIAHAVMQRQRLSLQYRSPGAKQATARIVSPQRLTHYRNAWYLEAWCHLRNAIRSFALDSFEEVSLTQELALDVSEDELHQALEGGYGIFSSSERQWARLCFSGKAAHYVSRETWHADQTGEWLDTEHFQLQLPYCGERELVMDILRHGADVEVLDPPTLRQAVLEQLQSALGQYAADLPKPVIAVPPSLILSPLHVAARKAADRIRHADGLLITAGAGIGVDSGLPDFRGGHGFWEAYPALGKAQLSFMDVASPQTFRTNPQLAWGFYGHRLKLYRETQPHEGFQLMHRWGERLLHGSSVFTSNVDGQFQKSGFAANRVTECHGSIHHLQCLDACNTRIESADLLEPEIDTDSCRWLGKLPLCPQCGALMRPNILMFGDWEWLGQRSDEQRQRLNHWLEKPQRLVIIELGAGTTIATVRRAGERLLNRDEVEFSTLIRINPTESEGPVGTVSMCSSALAGLQAIAETLGW
ncbi:WYL domain-containing protein [Chitinibacter sp. GC72]|uniref:WYL domain-containing protein n=1 Tax=Chitinibacter sp. GC72 TaxID=1526917 RepID=UPI0018DF64F2|nr:WYL domain-containing protein [Chitinibacter sp. GC72]